MSTGGFWEGVKRVVKNAGDFVAEHKEEIGLGALAILGTVAEIAINSNDDSDDEGIGVLMKALAIIRILHFQTIASYQILLVSPMKENIQIHTHRRKNTQSLDTASITILRTA